MNPVRRTFRIPAVLCCACLLPSIATAESSACPGVHVPLDRLLTNLGASIVRDPSWGNYYALARAHSIAYAREVSTVLTCAGTEPVLSTRTDNGSETLQPTVEPAQDAPRRREAQGHLAAALDAYRQAQVLAPEVALVRLSHGWVLQQAGRAGDARREYRRAIELAWPHDREVNGRRTNPDRSPVLTMGPAAGQRFITTEAARFLLPLLDPRRDAAEIASLRERVAFIERGPRAVAVVVLPPSRQ